MTETETVRIASGEDLAVYANWICKFDAPDRAPLVMASEVKKNLCSVCTDLSVYLDQKKRSNHSHTPLANSRA